ncbi:MAG: hypothetical protein LBK98_06655 [Peptococcaceae bacterium]|nr:hypothetical protein [Peptococcaceae bacterium]
MRGNKLKRRVATVLIITLSISVMGGCGLVEKDDRPLWQKYVDAQYNSLKPQLDHMIKKYGEEFTMSYYGTVFSVEHPDWRVIVEWDEKAKAFRDNYIIRLRSNELEELFYEIIEPIYGDCKIYSLPCDTAFSSSNVDTNAEELLTGDRICVQICFFVIKDPSSKTEDFQKLVQTLEEKQYIAELAMLYVDVTGLAEVTRENHNDSFFSDESRYSWRLVHGINKYYQWDESRWRKGELVPSTEV